MKKYPKLTPNERQSKAELGDSYGLHEIDVPHIYVHFNEEYPQVAGKIFKNLKPHKRDR